MASFSLIPFVVLTILRFVGAGPADSVEIRDSGGGGEADPIFDIHLQYKDRTKRANGRTSNGHRAGPPSNSNGRGRGRGTDGDQQIQVQVEIEHENSDEDGVDHNHEIIINLNNNNGNGGAPTSAVTTAPAVLGPDNKPTPCDGIYTLALEEPIIINSHRYGKNVPYPFNVNCSYTIKGDASCKDGLQVTCPEVDIRDQCSDEYLQLVAGGVSKVLCGSTTLTNPITGPSLKVTFKTLQSGPSDRFYKGWKCRISCVLPTPPPRPIKCDGSYQLGAKKSVIFQSLYFDTIFRYPENSQCTYTVLGDSSCDVSVTCPAMEVRDCARGEYLLLQAADGTHKKLCNNETLTQALVSPKFTITARTVGNPQIKRLFKGWMCEFMCVPPKVTTTTTTTKPTTTTKKSTTKRPTPKPTPAPAPAYNCKPVDITVDTKTGVKIFSPNYKEQQNYPAAATCIFNIMKCAVGYRYDMITLDLRYDPTCAEEYVEFEVLGSGLKDRYCNQDRLPVISRTPKGTRDQMKVTFKSSSKPDFDRYYKGFLLEIGCLPSDTPNPVVPLANTDPDQKGPYSLQAKCFPTNLPEAVYDLKNVEEQPEHGSYEFTGQLHGYPPGFRCTHIFNIPSGCVLGWHCDNPRLRFNSEKSNKCPDEYYAFTEVPLDPEISRIKANYKTIKLCGDETYARSPVLFFNSSRTKQFRMEFVTRNVPLPSGTTNGFKCRMWCFKSVDELMWSNNNPDETNFPDGRIIPHKDAVNNKQFTFRTFESQTTWSTYDPTNGRIQTGKSGSARSIKGKGQEGSSRPGKGQQGRSSASQGARGQQGRSSASQGARRQQGRYAGSKGFRTQ